jgi:hypothetical protein
MPNRWRYSLDGRLGPGAGIAADGQEKGIVGMATDDADWGNPSDLADAPSQAAQPELEVYGVPVRKRSLTGGTMRVRWRRRKPGVDAVGTAIADARTEVLQGQPGPVRIADWGARVTYSLVSMLPFFVLTAHARVPVTVGLCVLGACGLVRAWCMALIADREFLVVRNFLWTRRIAWKDVAQFKDGSTYAGESSVWALCIVLKKGLPVISQGTAATGAEARPATAATIVRIARRHDIPESLTGREPKVRPLWSRRSPKR